MTLETATLIEPSTARSPAQPFADDRVSCNAIVPVLIQVPRLSPTARRATARRVAGRRRRLRREVRVAGIAMLCALPLAWVILATGAGHPEAAAGTAAEDWSATDLAARPMPTAAPGGDRPIVSISLEPARDIAPVVMEGIVPDVGPEEGGHAGG